MTSSDDTGAEPSGFVPLVVERRARVDLESAESALADLAWLGSRVDGPSDQPGVRRIATDLELPILDGSSTTPVRKAALIDLGPPRLHGGAVTLSVGWRSATAAPLFPVFEGELRIGRDRLVLRGHYVPPFGRVGLVIDATLLQFIARRTAQAFLARIAAEVAD